MWWLTNYAQERLDRPICCILRLERKATLLILIRLHPNTHNLDKLKHTKKAHLNLIIS
ncbi:hypothetical protein ACE6H2_016102 [Prunus campanulata]